MPEDLSLPPHDRLLSVQGSEGKLRKSWCWT